MPKIFLSRFAWLKALRRAADEFLPAVATLARAWRSAPQRNHRLATVATGRFSTAGRLTAIVVLTMGGLDAAEPELKTVFPLGCGRGQSIEITLSGDGFEDGGSLFFSRADIHWEHLEKNRFRIEVRDDAPLGDCDVWIATAGGLAGPRRFVISDIPVASEQADNDASNRAQSILLPTILDASFEAADVDWFTFKGEAGQLVSISCRSKSLDGTAQPVITLVGPAGRELAHSRADRLEPLLHYRFSESGSYRLLIRDRAYRKDDFSCYRLAVRTGPQTFLAVPHVVPNGDCFQVRLLGFELPGGQLYEADSELRILGFDEPLQGLRVGASELARSSSTTPSYLSPAAFMLKGSRLRHERFTGYVQLGFSNEPIIVESSSTSSAPQPIEIPCRIAGRFQTQGDVDWFRFSAKQDVLLQFEAFGERLDQLMDLELAVYDMSGKQLQVLGDSAAPKGIPTTLPLASLDAAGTWKAPQDGEYDLAIRDLYGSSVYGVNRIYELLVERQQARFQVVAMHPGSQASRGVTVARGSSAELQLIALRTGGFAGPIHVRAEQASPGVSIEPCTIPGKETTKAIKIEMSPSGRTGVQPLRLVAEAEIGSDKQTVPVLSATVLRSGATRFTAATVIQIAEK